MIPAERTVLVLLAAGKSERFGASKLDQELWGKPLGLHAALALAELTFLSQVAVVGDCRVDYAAHGFRVLANTDPARDMASSLRIGAAAAAEFKADALLIALADMPCVTAAHVRALLVSASGPEAVVASADDSARKPPVVFGSARFADLVTITGDQGARTIIQNGESLRASPETLVDVDTPADLETLRASRLPPHP